MDGNTQIAIHNKPGEQMILDRWLIIGFTAQLLFSMRFLVQWVASEKRKESIMPVSFWYFSIAGGGMLLMYAIHKSDPIFILGQAAGLIIYVRNLILIMRKSGVSKS